jgi:predicted glycosyltransferase
MLCSVRDIVVMRDDPARYREIVDCVRRDIDRVLVHGDPALIPFQASFPPAPDIADRLVYTGYVASLASRPNLSPLDLLPNPLPQAGEGSVGALQQGNPEIDKMGVAAGTGEVIVSAGGGAAGKALLESALAARRAGCLADRPWRLITGTNLPNHDITALQAGAPPGVVIERFRDDFPALLRACRVSVSQAGYNTVLDLLAARARAVLVPFAAGRETEQTLRAEFLAALGAAELVRESELSPAALAATIERAAARPRPSLAIDTDGAARSARLIAGMIGAETIDTDGADSRCFAAPVSRVIVE